MIGRSALGVLVTAFALAAHATGQQPTKGAPKAAAPKAAAPAPKPGVPPASPVVVVKRDNPCSVLLPGEVGQVLGTPITMREVMDEVTCHFDYDKPQPGLPPYFEMKVHYKDGRSVVTSARVAGKLLGGKGSGFEPLPGIGDEAWLAPYASLLVFRKGDAGVEMDLRLVTNGREKGIRLAKLVAQRLAAAGF